MERLSTEDTWYHTQIDSLTQNTYKGLGPKLSSLMKVNFACPLEIKAPESGGRVAGEAQNPRGLRSSVTFSQSLMVWGAMPSAGVGPLGFLRSKVNAADKTRTF